MVSQSFLATRKNSGDLFELKILSTDMQSDKLQALTSFYKEFKHHNILSFLDSLQSENGEIALISEFKQGITLDRLFHHLSKINKKMPVHLVSFIITEICTGLDYIHSRRMQQNGITNSNAYHGLQRENIFISNTGEIKIRSVELAALRYKFIKDNLNGSDEALHSIVAPEYFSNSAHIDFRADIYALGIIFLELLAGQKLPVNASPASLIDNIFKNNSAYFAERPIEVMDKLRSILGKILADNPDRRYAATNQLYMDLLHQLILTASNANFTQDLADFIEESDIELLGSVLIPPLLKKQLYRRTPPIQAKQLPIQLKFRRKGKITHTIQMKFTSITKHWPICKS